MIFATAVCHFHRARSFTSRSRDSKRERRGRSVRDSGRTPKLEERLHEAAGIPSENPFRDVDNAGRRETNFCLEDYKRTVEHVRWKFTGQIGTLSEKSTSRAGRFDRAGHNCRNYKDLLSVRPSVRPYDLKRLNPPPNELVLRNCYSTCRKRPEKTRCAHLTTVSLLKTILLETAANNEFSKSDDDLLYIWRLKHYC